MSKDEWEMALFLFCSRLSKRLLDEFLNVTVVISSPVHCFKLNFLRLNIFDRYSK